MADRMHQYPMFPQSLTPNSLQQSQIPQQPPQSQQPDPQMISALSNPEHSRMWQQMNQLQNAYRSQQSGDLAASQMNPQIQQEFARGQALSHGQGQPIIQQMQQSFALNAQRMNPPVFHDLQGGPSQSLMPSNFANLPLNTQQQLKASFNMNPAMHGLNNPGVSRQLKMLSQQEMARLQQSGLSAQHASNQQPAVDMFVSSSMQPSQGQMHGSPHSTAQPVGPPGSNQGMVPGNPQQSVQKRMAPAAEFQERRNFLLGVIQQSENNMQALMQSIRNAPSVDPHVQEKINNLRADLQNRKDMYNKFLSTYSAMLTQQMPNGIPPPNMAQMNHMAHSTSQQPQQAPVSNNPVQPGFVSQANQPVTGQYNLPAGNGPSPLPAQGPGALNQQIPIQPTPIGRPSTIPPPRTGGTPHQLPGGQLPNTMSPNLGNFAIQGGQKVPNQPRQSGGIMPLDQQRFESTYGHFCRSQNINVGLRVPIGDNRTVDLHQLHVQVMHEGGAKSVTQRDMWATIGGRLGIVQFPGNEGEPGRAGPGIAQQLHNTYEQYLQHFENAYIMTVKNRPVTGSPQQQMHQMNPNSLAIGNNATAGMSGNSTEIPPNPNPARPLINQQVIVAAARYAHMSVQEMRAQRLQDPMITFVERHRPELQKVYQQQQHLQQLAKRNAEQEQQSVANARNQMPSMHDQPSINLQIQRPNPMGNAPPGDPQMANGSFGQENAAPALHKQPVTQEQFQHARLTVNHLKQVFQQRSLPAITTAHVPEEQRLDFDQLLEQVFKMTSDLEQKLHLYFLVFKNEQLLGKFVAIVLTVARQRQLISSLQPQYIITLTTLRSMQIQVLKLNEEFDTRWRAVKAAAHNPTANPPQHVIAPTTRAPPLTVPPVQNPNTSITPSVPQSGRSSQISQVHPSPSQSSLQIPPQPPSHSHPTQPQSQSQPHPQQQQPQPPIKKQFPPSPPAPPASSAIASPTPHSAAASSSTPATSVPTPQTAAGSPQTPKSPPSKAISKVKSAARGSHRRSSIAGKSSATPESAPSVAGVKRPPEEDVATLTSVAPLEAEASNAPSPKKAKTEWEGEASEALIKKQQELENIKTEEDAAAFFDRMKELFAMTASTDNEIHHDIASTLDQILAGVAQEPADAAAMAASLSVHGAGDAGPPPTALSPHMGPANDAFLEFIDFSSFTTLEDEDNDSKATTPDLVHSSETNPSPESGSEGELLGSTGSPDKSKLDDSGDRSDPLRLGSLKEIDGGESAYYQVDNWKWEGAMHTLDQPWAIFTS